VASPVLAENELVEIGADVGAAEAMIDAHSEPLEVREDAADPGRPTVFGKWVRTAIPLNDDSPSVSTVAPLAATNTCSVEAV
jgi:hypothetical protein